MGNLYFAALGDVWKHLPLAEILRLNPPRHYWETHAGSASYLLTESTIRRHVAMRFLELAPKDDELKDCAYLEALLETPGVYPGSPLLAMGALGGSANYLFCDTDPESTRSLRTVSQSLSARIVEDDGVSMVAREEAARQVSPANVLVVIDPYNAHERLSEDSLTPIELAASLAIRGYRVFYWYRYQVLTRRWWALEEISELAPGVDLWCGGIVLPAPFILPAQSGLWGCGVVLANGSEEERQVCARLGRALQRLYADDILPGNDPDRLTFDVMKLEGSNG
jgi:hypothetical protein